MRVLITGGSGYIGQRLSALLRAQDHDVVNYDLVHGLDVRNIVELGVSARLCDAAVHLAAISGVPACAKDPYGSFSTNVSGVINITRVCQALSIPLVFASSFAALEGSTIYGMQKAWGEEVIRNFSGVRHSILHFSNVYGGPDYIKLKSSVIAKFIAQARRGEPLTIYGDGEQTRDFIHVDDICVAILHCLLYRKMGTFDICTGVTSTVNEIADVVVEHFSVPRVYTEGHGTYCSPEGDSSGTRNELGTPEPLELIEEVRKLCES